MYLPYMGLADRIYEDAIEVYFHLPANERDQFRTDAALAIVVTRDLRFITGASVCLAVR
jgi:hypothetical protein